MTSVTPAKGNDALQPEPVVEKLTSGSPAPVTLKAAKELGLIEIRNSDQVSISEECKKNGWFWAFSKSNGHPPPPPQSILNGGKRDNKLQRQVDER